MFQTNYEHNTDISTEMWSKCDIFS